MTLQVSGHNLLFFQSRRLYQCLKISERGNMHRTGVILNKLKRDLKCIKGFYVNNDRMSQYASALFFEMNSILIFKNSTMHV